MRSIKRTFRQVFPVASALTVAVLAAGCGEDPVDPPPPVPTTITISPETATLVSLGETVQLTATVHDQHGAVMTGIAVTWASRDPSVVTVSSGGLVTAAGNGTTAVEASAGDAVGSAAMTTQQRPAEVRVTPSAETLVALGDTVRLSAEALDANGHTIQGAEFTWASGDESVATVDGTGLVTAVFNGSASVTAAIGGVSGSAEVAVEQQPAEVRVTPSAETLVALGDTVRLSAEALDANGHAIQGTEFTWTSGDESVLTVDGTGLVTAVSNGSASVTAVIGDVSGSAEVAVEQRPAEVRVTPHADTLVALGDTVRLLGEALDANGHLVAGTEFTWASGDESVLTVDGTGLVTAVGRGSATVTVTTGEISGGAELTVEQQPAEVRVTPLAETLVALGSTIRLSAEALDANGHPVQGAEFTWASGDESVATVDGTGLVTAVSNGSASVTAAIGDVSGNAAVTVAQQPAEVRVTPPADTLVALGDTLRLSAEALDANGHFVAGTEFTWASSDESVLAVDGTGLVTAVGRGSATVTATTGEIFGVAEVTVDQRPFEVRVPPADTLAALGDTLRLSAEALDANGSLMPDAEFTWSSGDETVATVDGTGLVTAVANGNTSVAAAIGDVSGSTAVTVRQQPADVRVTPAADTLVALGDTVRLSAAADDANGHNVADAEFTWASGDESVLAVDGTGLVTAVGRGSATVTATTGQISGTAELTVDQRPFEVRVTLADTLAALGDTVRLSAQALDANGHALPDAEFMWASADESVVTVDSMGLVAAVSNGSAEVAASVSETTGGTLVTVWQKAVEMRLWPLADTLLVPDTVRLSAEASDANGHVLTNGEFVWSSGNVAVATVDADGLVRAQRGGSARVTVTEAASLLSRVARLWVLEPQEELEEFYEALGGLGWTNSENWGTDAPLDEWYGVTTDEDGRITELDLSSNGLQGEIPRELALIESLEVLDLSGNGVGGGAAEPAGVVSPGWLPTGAEILRVPGWVYDELPGAEFRFPEMARRTWQASADATTSALPDTCAFPSFPLSEPGDGLTGTIPPELGTLPNLRFLDLSDNSLAGEIPSELGNLESLVYLDLSANHLTGEIPPELGELGSLAAMCLHNNARWIPSDTALAAGLTGPIPPELGSLENLRDLWLGVNRLSGAIPPELGNLGSLEGLHLTQNQLTGVIPRELGTLGNLETLYLYSNHLTGAVPPELGELASLVTLGLASNNLTGEIPAELGGLESLENLVVSGNQLTGTIPRELGNLKNLRVLSVGINQLTGAIPHELGGLQNVRLVALGPNQLTGAIPPELGNLANLEVLGLHQNQLTGAIPPELGNLANLETAILSTNQLTGSIPLELGNLSNLGYLGLHGNQLTGSIPRELGNLESLYCLVLGLDTPGGPLGNSLAGPIPLELSNLKNLSILSLSHNQLTGAIPPELEDLRALSNLRINSTQLTGAIPAGFVDFRLRQFHWQDTELCAPATDAFQTWLESIQDHMGGDTCSSGSSANATDRSPPIKHPSSGLAERGRPSSTTLRKENPE